MAFNKNRILHGTEGRVYIDSVMLAEVQSIDVKESPDYDTLTVNGSYVKAHRYTGSEVSGTITVHKWNSYMLTNFANVHKTGVTPDITINCVLYDPQTKQSQRVALYGVQFTEINLGGFTNGELLTEDMPFTADDYEVLEVIE